MSALTEQEIARLCALYGLKLRKNMGYQTPNYIIWRGERWPQRLGVYDRKQRVGEDWDAHEHPRVDAMYLYSHSMTSVNLLRQRLEQFTEENVWQSINERDLRYTAVEVEL